MYALVRPLGLASFVLLTGAAWFPPWATAVEPAVMATTDDGNHAVLLPQPTSALPTPPQLLFAMPIGARPHGAAFLGGHEVLFAEFSQALIYRAALATPGTVQTLTLTGRTSANGTLATAPLGRFALSVGVNLSNGAGESVVLDFATDPPQITPIAPALKVLSFVTDAIDFAPDGRAFVCHATGVSVLSPPYTTVDFTMPFPTLAQSGSQCALTPDGSRLFVTRLVSEVQAAPNGVRTTAAPYSASSVFTLMPAPADVQGLGPLAVAPDGQSLLVGQQFVFPQAPNPPRARLFLLRAPFDGQTAYNVITLPANTVGPNCQDGMTSAFDCSGFEHIEVSADGRLAILSGNSAATVASFADSVPAVFVSDPFDNGTRQLSAVQIATGQAVPGRGTGAVRFQPAGVFRAGFEEN